MNCRSSGCRHAVHLWWPDASPVAIPADHFYPATHWTLPSVLPPVLPLPVTHNRLFVAEQPHKLHGTSCNHAHCIENSVVISCPRRVPYRRSYGDPRNSSQQKFNSSSLPAKSEVSPECWRRRRTEKASHIWDQQNSQYRKCAVRKRPRKSKADRTIQVSWKNNLS